MSTAILAEFGPSADILVGPVIEALVGRADLSPEDKIARRHDLLAMIAAFEPSDPLQTIMLAQSLLFNELLAAAGGALLHETMETTRARAQTGVNALARSLHQFINTFMRLRRRADAIQALGGAVNGAPEPTATPAVEPDPVQLRAGTSALQPDASAILPEAADPASGAPARGSTATDEPSAEPLAQPAAPVIRAAIRTACPSEPEPHTGTGPPSRQASNAPSGVFARKAFCGPTMHRPAFSAAHLTEAIGLLCTELGIKKPATQGKTGSGQKAAGRHRLNRRPQSV